MIKFRTHPKFWKGERCKFEKVSGKCQNYMFFDIFWDLLNKMKNNLGQECVKEGILSFQGKSGTTAPDFLGKMTVFPVLTLLFCLPLLKIWLSHPRKNYIFEMSNNKAIQQKSFITLSLRL